VFVFRGETLQTVIAMSVTVQKYGGTSVADPSRISAVADRVTATRGSGDDVVVVVSAMGQTTDELLALAAAINPHPPPREMDMLLTAGDRITMALLAMALDVRGVPAVSYTGSQAGILTDSSHGEARIREVTGQRVRDSLAEGKVVIVAGFQGVDPERREITTLGRGGSDTTAVALAAALEAEVCEILTDVDGVYTADPRVVPEARKIDSIGYHEMMEMASSGAGVLMPHSVEFAHRHGVPVHVRSSFSDAAGTWVVPNAPASIVVGLAHRQSEGRGLLSIIGGGAGSVVDRSIEALSEEGISVLDTEVRGLGVTIELPPERLEDATRLLHMTLHPPLVSEEVPA
jgi:aspartate kinase